MGMGKLAALATVTVVLLVSLMGELRGEAASEPLLAFLLDLTGQEQDTVSVVLQWESPRSPAKLIMDGSYGEGLAMELSSHVFDERATTASGEELRVRREGKAWYVDGKGKIVFNYRVRLSGYEAGTSYLSSLAASMGRWPYFPFRESDLAYLPGYAVFVRPELPLQAPVDLEVQLPEGWTRALPLREGPYELGELLSDPLLAGEIAVLEREGLLLALPDACSPATRTLEEFADKVTSSLSQLQSAFPGGGEVPSESGAGSIAIILLPGGGGERVEDAFYFPEPFAKCAVLALPEDADILSDACLEAAVRETATLFLRRSLLAQPEARWLLAGAAWYLQDLLPYRAGVWGGTLSWDRFSGRYQAYREALERKPISLARAGAEANGDGDAAVILACGGAAACAALDAELQARQPAALDLVSFLARLAALRNYEGGGLANVDVRSLLEALSGRDWPGFFRDYIEGAREVPASSFSSLRIAGEEGSPLPARGEGESTSAPEWVLLAVAVFLVLLIPFVMEPYTMRPRKPGFLEKKLREED